MRKDRKGDDSMKNSANMFSRKKSLNDVKRTVLRTALALMLALVLSLLPASSGLSHITDARAASAKLSLTRFTLVEGKSKTITVKGGKATAWKSSDTKVATVSKGKVKALSCGVCDITATVGGKTLTCKLQVVPSEEDAQEKILAMKKKYPEGTSWTSKNSYTFKHLNNKSMTVNECQAFAFMMSDAAYGDLPAYVTYDFGQLKPGDVIFVLAGSRLSDGSSTSGPHAVCVVSADYDKDELIVCEGNYLGTVHWDAKLTISEFATYAGQVVITRYLHPGVADYLKKPGAEKITSNEKESDGYYYVRWKKLDKNCEGYQILLSDKKDMPWKETAVYYQAKNYNYVCTDWGEEYYFRVRAFNFDNGKITYGKWSKVKKVKM